MKEFDVPLKKYYWTQKWCVDVKNIDSYKNINGRCTLQISEGHTQDISKFRYHLWEPIWYFKKCKAPETSWQLENVCDLHTPLYMKCDTTLRHRRKNQSKSLD